MLIRTKIIISLTPLILLVTVASGYFSYIKSRDTISQQEQLLLSVLLNSTVNDKLTTRNNLLIEAGLSKVDIFVDAYQKEAMSDLNSLAKSTNRIFLIIDRNKQTVIFDSSNSASINEIVLPFTLEATSNREINIKSKNYLYDDITFAPWNWHIIALSPYANIHKPLDEILLITFISGIIALVGFLISVSVISQRLLFSKIDRLSSATKYIARHSQHAQIDMPKTDELGYLASDIEIMSEKIENTIEKANKANAAKTNFLAVMSHEIRTPLNGVIGMINLLKSTPLNEEQRNYLNDLSYSGNSLKSLINDILDLTKIESGGLKLETTDVNLGLLIESLSATLKAPVIENQNKLEIECDYDPNTRILSDIMRIKQVAFNLLSNANKFTHHGVVKLNINVALENERHILHISVSDTGIGIDKNHLSHIFDSFTQSDNTITRKYGGSGLGLSIVKRIVNAMQGEITVDSTVGKGSHFRVAIPVTVEQRLVKHKQSSPTDLPPTPFAKKQTMPKFKVLFAEDNEINATIVIHDLSTFECELKHVWNGKEALDEAKENQYDLILLDIHMPIMDGLEACKKIRRLDGPNKTTPIIGVTAESFAERIALFKREGMNDVLSKPYEKDEFNKLVRKYAEKGSVKLNTVS